MSSNVNEPEIQGHDVRNPEVGYEPTDMSTRAVFGFFIALAVAGVLVILAMWGVFRYLAKEELAAHPTAGTISTTKEELAPIGGDPAVKFPAPRLQPDPVADLNKFRAREEEILNSYGWVDEANGRAHIPIEQAINVVAKTGLPTRPNAAAPPNPSSAAAGGAGGINVSRGADEQEAQAAAQQPAAKQR